MSLLCLRTDEEVGPLPPLSASLAAGFSGIVAAAASHCFDTAKSRAQCIVLPKVCRLLHVTCRMQFSNTFIPNHYCINDSTSSINADKLVCKEYFSCVNHT